MAKVSAYTAHTGAALAAGDLIYIVDVSDGTSGSQSMTMTEFLKGAPTLGFNPATTGIMAVNGTTQWNWDDGAIYPETDNDVDLGKAAKEFKDGYFDGTLYCDALDLNGTAVTATAAELNYTDVAAAGTVEASKAVVVDSNKDALGFRNVSATNLDLGASGTAGTLDVFPSTATSGKLALSVTDQTGDTTVSVVIGAMADARTITLRDPGAAASFLTTTDATAAATTATAVELNYLDITTLGTGAASKAVVLDAGEDYTWPATGVLTYGVLNDGTTALAATALELNRTCDVSTRLVAVGGTSLAVTVALHDGKIIKLDHTAAASTCTLPDATGSGAVFRFIVTAVNTNNHIITVPDANNVLKGSVNLLDNDSNAQTAYAASGTDDTITLNGGTTGGQIGDWVELVDIAADTWAIRGQLVCPAGSNVADPFSAAV